jgi:hypothetical protein
MKSATKLHKDGPARQLNLYYDFKALQDAVGFF